MNDRIGRLLSLIEQLGVTKYNLATTSGIGPSNLNKMLEGEQTITDKTLYKIVAAFPQVNIDWLKTGEGEMLKPGYSSNYTVGSGLGFQGTTAGHDVNQTNTMNTPEKIFEDFISGLKTQNRLIEKAMDQNTATRAQLDRSMNQTDKAMEQNEATRSLLERSMDQTDKLISIIQNNLIK